MTGFNSKRAAAADKLHWSDCAVHNEPAYPTGECDCGVAQEPEMQTGIAYQKGFHDGKKAALAQPPLPVQRTWAQAIEAKLKEKNA